MIEIKRAIISCWDKSGLPELAGALAARGVDIISSGGTAAHLQENGIAVQAVSDLTGYPEVLGGRVKTLHPLIHAAILATDAPDHQADLRKLGIEPVQLVVVNLYPFVREAVGKQLPLAKAVEYIDIGGPTLLRAAAKNYAHVVVLSAPEDYASFLEFFQANEGKIPAEFREHCARKTFFYTSWYDGQIQAYLGDRESGDGPAAYQTRHYERTATLRYGENPHQGAAVYRPFGDRPSGLAGMTQLGGKPMSFNNYMDVQAAYALVLEFDVPAVTIVKHTNPCGAAVSGLGIADAFEKALRGDPVSAFGGIVAFNRSVDRQSAEKMAGVFFECIIAPAFAPDALEILQKKKNLRLLTCSPQDFPGEGIEIKALDGTVLLQDADRPPEDPAGWKVVTRRKPTVAELEELSFAWKIVKHVKSNAIVLTRDREIYGTGAGQMSRVDSVKIAQMKAEQAERSLEGLVLASDAFFPFRDGIDHAARGGVRAIVQPGGSIRDEEVIAAADEHGISMVFTGIRHFKH